MMEHSFRAFLSESNALQAINVSELGTMIGKELKRLGVEFKGIEGKFQRVFGGSELQIRINDAIVDKQKLDYFGIQVQQDGNVTGDASSRKLDRKHLILSHSLGKLSIDSLNTKDLGKIVQRAIKEIKHSIDVELG